MANPYYVSGTPTADQLALVAGLPSDMDTTHEFFEKDIIIPGVTFAKSDEEVELDKIETYLTSVNNRLNPVTTTAGPDGILGNADDTTTPKPAFAYFDTHYRATPASGGTPIDTAAGEIELTEALLKTIVNLGPI